jgi:hypothetical protein
MAGKGKAPEKGRDMKKWFGNTKLWDNLGKGKKKEGKDKKKG